MRCIVKCCHEYYKARDSESPKQEMIIVIIIVTQYSYFTLILIALATHCNTR